MSEDAQTGLLNDFFNGGWRVAPFIKTSEGYIGVKAWPKRAATNHGELQKLLAEQAEKTHKTPIFGISPSRGRYVVDIDTKKNPQALQLWKDKVVEAYGDAKLAIPNLVVKTKSGGYHLYYSDGSDRQLHSPTSVFSKDSGIDIRGYTGMVIAPTSIGTEMDWQLGEYVIIKGNPTSPPTVLGLSKILGDSFDEVDTFVKNTLSQINEVLRNDSTGELNRWKLIPNDLIIPSSNRDNTLYRCARMCRLADLSQESANIFMSHIAQRCEVSPEEPVEHWLALAADKVKRVYSSDTEMKLQTISGFFEELDNSGCVLLRGVSKSYYYFRFGSKILRIDARSKYSTDNFANVLQGISIQGEDGPIPVKKFLGNYMPKDVAYNAAMYPKADLPFFEFEGNRYVNTYSDPFAGFEPDPYLIEKASKYVERFYEFARHITGYETGDDEHLLNKIAWILQKPYRRLPTATIIYSHTRGSGKDVFVSLIRELVGRSYYMPITLKSIENDHTVMHDKLVCVASEVQLQTNARGNIAAAAFMGVLKDKITQKNTYVDEKFVQAYSAPMYVSFFLLSNFELSSIIEPGDRRFDIFHATEEKLDQERFGELADISNDGIWIERSAGANLFRKHVIYAIRQSLLNREISNTFDREEAVMNSVKQDLVDSQHPPMALWMQSHLPAYFTEDVAMMACHFCPLRSSPEYIIKQLREHFGPEMRPLYRNGRTVHRLNGSPKFEMRNDGGNRMPMLNFKVGTADTSARKSVYSISKGPRSVDPSDQELRQMMQSWYNAMVQQYYGNTVVLPNQKPDDLTA